MNKRLLTGDAVIVGVIALSLMAAAYQSVPPSAETVSVICDGEIAAVLPLDANTVFSPDDGHTVVTVQDGKAYVSHADCPDGICGQGVIDQTHTRPLVCLPNRVAILVSGIADGQPFDGLETDGVAG